MGYQSLAECVDDLESAGQLVRITEEVDPYLEAAEIQRRVYEAQGPAVYYSRVKGCKFPMVSNLFGTIDRTRYMFRDTLALVEKMVALKVDPAAAAKNPLKYLGLPRLAWNMRPKIVRSGPVTANETTVDQMPQIHSWPDDGGAFVTLPAVYTEDPNRLGYQKSNLGMYRIQLSGGEYKPNVEVGLHYQIHRGIGVHHSAALQRGESLPVSIFIGGPPVMPLSAVMPLPEGFPEVTFAGALGGRRVRLIRGKPGTMIAADADFCITGTVDPNRLLPEGPFGDHLGYYSLAHPFPVLTVDKVYHRSDAIYPFTTVGRPPQEDTSFGAFIHELTGPAIPTVVGGVHEVHAVDATGVHPLLLAIGSERYMPFGDQSRPQELLTCANAILGQGQLSLAKYLLIAAHQDNPELDIHDIPAFFKHMLERVDWQNDLHFQTRTTIDTLDYSGTGLNQGSKVVIAAVGPPRRELPADLPGDLCLPDELAAPQIAIPGVLIVQGPPFTQQDAQNAAYRNRFAEQFDHEGPVNRFPLVVIADDSDFTARTLNNFLWVTFTRSNPAADIHGVGSLIDNKHWGCTGSLIIDARIKPHHAPPLIEDAEVSKRVDVLGAPGGSLHGII